MISQKCQNRQNYTNLVTQGEFCLVLLLLKIGKLKLEEFVGRRKDTKITLKH